MAIDLNKLNRPLTELKGYSLDKDYNTVEVPAPVFVRDGEIFLNAETDIFVADYYREFGGDDIERSVREWAEANNGHWEWVNPGCLQFCKD